MNAPDLADVLAEVNRLRAERGMDPLDAMPKGEQGAASACPLAIGLAAVGGVCLSSYGTVEQDPCPMPHLLAEFLRAFDAGDYPELVAETA